MKFRLIVVFRADLGLENKLLFFLDWIVSRQVVIGRYVVQFFKRGIWNAKFKVNDTYFCIAILISVLNLLTCAKISKSCAKIAKISVPKIKLTYLINWENVKKGQIFC